MHDYLNRDKILCGLEIETAQVRKADIIVIKT